jgi:hypothetical protein
MTAPAEASRANPPPRAAPQHGRAGASDLHITTGSPPMLRIDDQLIPARNLAVLTPADTQRLCYSDPHRGAARALRAQLRARPLLRGEEPRALPRQHLPPARRGGGHASARSRSRSSGSRSWACPRWSPTSASPRPVAWCSSPAHGLGQDHHPRGHHRQDQRRDAAAHRHDRRPDRVHAPQQELAGQPA